VSYGDAFGSENFKLLEVDERILKELLQDGWVLDALQKKNIIFRLISFILSFFAVFWVCNALGWTLAISIRVLRDSRVM
jgi:hypothetical protein